MGKTFSCADWFGADEILQGGRSKDRRTVGNNRTLYRQSDGTITLRLHSTHVVVYHKDGTCTLFMGGWDSVITKQTINNFSPARVYSAGGRVKDEDGVPIMTAVWHSSDLSTPPKFQKCRKCHGFGEIVERCTGRGWPNYSARNEKDPIRALPGMLYRDVRHGYSWERCDICEANRNSLCQHAPGFEPHVRTYYPLVLREYRERWALRGCSHGFLESHIHRYECWNCKGCGERDYGSRPIPTRFNSRTQLRVDADGRVLGEESEVREFLAYKGKLTEFYDYRAGILAKMSGGTEVSN